MELRTIRNIYNDLTVDGGSVAAGPRDFARQLEAALPRWRLDEAHLVWLDLPVENAGHVPAAIDAGFRYHSADDGRLRLTLRLVENAYVPPPPTHYIGAGGVVLRESGALLVVSERYRRRGHGRHLKLPGGALQPGEHIEAAVRREILEETGIETRFRSLVCLRHWHGYRDGKSDIYFVCRLDPVTFDLACQDDEIEECLWMPVDEYLSHEDVHQFNRRIVRAALAEPGIVPETLPGYGSPDTHELFMPPETDS